MSFPNYSSIIIKYSCTSTKNEILNLSRQIGQEVLRRISKVILTIFYLIFSYKINLFLTKPSTLEEYFATHSFNVTFGPR